MESWKEQDARGECKSIELPAIRRAHGARTTHAHQFRDFSSTWKLPINEEIVYRAYDKKTPMFSAPPLIKTQSSPVSPVESMR